MKPRVVLLSAFLSPLRSGAEACAEEIALRLADEYDITIITAKLRRNLPRQDSLQDKVLVRRVGLGFSIDKWLFPFLAPFAATEIRPQLIHAVLESYAGLAMVICRWLLPVPTILTCQSTNTTFLLSLLHRSATRITCISQVLIRRAASFGRKDAVLIPNGIDGEAIRTACLKTHKVSGRVLFVGRLEYMKGIDTLLDAFVTQPASAQLYIVGRGSQKIILEAQAKKLRIEDRVHFLGYIPTPDVFAEFAAAKIFCGLSRSEALGNVFLEAQASGCAVVATNVGGIPDIVKDGVTGLLVPPEDPSAAAKALRELLTDGTKCHDLVEAGKLNAAAYDWNNLAKQYGEIYQALTTSAAAVSHI